MTDTINNVPRELKPCPFCGSEAGRATKKATWNLSRHRVACTNSGCGAHYGYWHPIEWNARALLSAPSPAGVDADHVEDVRAMVVPSIEAAYAIGAKGGSVVDAERLAFESWMAGHCWALGAAWDGTGYRCESEQAGQFSPAAGMTRQLWAAWRDRAALAATASVQQIAQNGGQA